MKQKFKTYFWTAYIVIALTFIALVFNIQAGPIVSRFAGPDWASPGAIGGTTPAAGSFTTLATSGDVTLTSDVSLGAAKHLVLPSHNDATTPTLAFGDGNTGFYESSDNALNVSIDAANKGGFTTSQFIYGVAAIDVSQSTAIVPNLLPFSGDENTGIGRAAADQLSLIAGGVEGQRITEASRTIETTATVGENDGGKLRIVTTADHALKVDDVTQFVAGTLPDGITAATNYYVTAIDTAKKFNLATSRGGTEISYIDTGSAFTSYELEITIDHYGDINANGAVGMVEIVTPSAVANYGKVYTKSDNKIYFQDGAGTEHVINIGAAGIKHEFHMPFEDPTGQVGNWDVVTINNAQDTHFIFQVSESFETLINAKVVMIPDASETIQWDINVSVAAAGEAYNNDDDSAADQQLVVSANSITEIDISGQLTGLSPGDYVAIDFQSDTNDLRIIGFEFDYE